MRKPTLLEAATALARIEFGGVPEGTFLESAVLQLTAGDYSGALATASHGLQQSLSPEQVWKAHCLEVEAALRVGQPELAVTAARWLKEYDPFNKREVRPFTNARIAQVAFYQGQHAKALDVLHDTLNKYGATALIYHDIGSIFYAKGDVYKRQSQANVDAIRFFLDSTSRRGTHYVSKRQYGGIHRDREWSLLGHAYGEGIRSRGTSRQYQSLEHYLAGFVNHEVD